MGTVSERVRKPKIMFILYILILLESFVDENDEKNILKLVSIKFSLLLLLLLLWFLLLLLLLLLCL